MAVRKAFELRFGTESIYSLESFDDFGFRFADFKPDILIVSCKLTSEENKKYVDELLQTTDILCLTLGFPNEIKEACLNGWDYQSLEMPLDFSTLVEKTLSFASD